MLSKKAQKSQKKFQKQLDKACDPNSGKYKNMLVNLGKAAAGCAVVAVTGVLMHKAGKKEGYGEGFESGIIHSSVDIAWFEKETGERFEDHIKFKAGEGKLTSQLSDEFCDKVNADWLNERGRNDVHVGSKMKKEEA